jgi:hypothetical protein
MGIHGPQFIDWLYDEMELGARVAHELDSSQAWTPALHYWWQTRTPQNAPELFDQGDQS